MKCTKSCDHRCRRCGKTWKMNNLYSSFTHAQNIQDGCWFGPRYTTAKHGSAVVTSADTFRLTCSNFESHHHPHPQRESRLRPAVSWLWDAQTLRPGLIRAAGREEEPAPSACRQHASSSARATTPAKLSLNNRHVWDKEADLIAHVKTELRFIAGRLSVRYALHPPRWLLVVVMRTSSCGAYEGNMWLKLWFWAGSGWVKQYE